MKFRAGKYSVDLVIQDWFRLDGGIAYGGIPTEKWKKFSLGPTTFIDEKGRAQLSINCFYISTPDGMGILIDTSFGNYNLWKAETVVAFHLRKGFNIFDLPPAYQPPKPDLIIPTHLHFDHAGGIVKEIRGGELAPRFPRSTYIFHRDELKHCLSTHPKTRSSYLRETIAGVECILEKTRTARIHRSKTKVTKEVCLIKTRGHTPGHLAVKIESEGQTIFIPGGLCPTRWHINILACGVGNDTHALENTNRKMKFLTRAAKENWLLLLEHDPDVAGYVKQEGKEKFTFIPYKDML